MKTKLTFAVTLALVMVFTVFFVAFKKRHDAERDKAAAIAETNRRVQVEDENRTREILRVEAEKRATQIKRERDAQHTLEDQEKADRIDLLARRDAALSEVARLTREKEKMMRTIAEEQALLDRAELERTRAEAERTFLRTYIAEARDSIARIDALVARVEEARQSTAAAAASTSR